MLELVPAFKAEALSAETLNVFDKNEDEEKSDELIVPALKIEGEKKRDSCIPKNLL